MKKERKGRWWVSRGLDKMESKFGTKSIQKVIEQRLQTQKIVRILELGFGDGKCLLDIRTLFPDKRVQLYGVNKKKGKFASRKDFITIAKKFELPVPKPELLPRPFFYDAGEGLKFKSNYFDIIMSQVAFHYIGDKAKLIEEFWRVLKPHGKAFLEVDSYKEIYPDFMQTNKETPRFLIYDGKKLVKLSNYLKKFQKKGFNIKLKRENNGTAKYLLIEKNMSKPLKLGLKYEDDLSFDLTTFNSEKEIFGIWWGNRSVFKVK